MIRKIFSRTDIFLLFVIFIAFLSSLILTICKCIKKAILTFALATILLILFWKNIIINTKFLTKVIIQKNHQKLLPNSHKVSLHRHYPKITQHHLQLLKILKHLHEFLFKTIHTLLKNDTLVYQNH